MFDLANEGQNIMTVVGSRCFFHRGWALRLVLLFLTTIAITTTVRADVSCITKDSHCSAILINGDIKPEDSMAFRHALNESPLMDMVFLSSHGGDVKAALEIGQIIRQHLMITFAPTRRKGVDSLFSPHLMRNLCEGQDCICASSCFFIWAAGAERGGDAIYIHRPYDTSGTFSKLSAEMAHHQYALWLKSIEEYLSKMEVPSRFMEIIKQTPSTSAYRLTNADIDSIGEFPPTIFEWLVSSCGSIADDAFGQSIKLQKSKSPSVRQRGQELFEQSQKVSLCYRSKLLEDRLDLFMENKLK